MEISKNDTLICINKEPLDGKYVTPPLEVLVEYNVKKVYICTCGQTHLDVGLTSVYNWIKCYKCDKQLPDDDKIHWCHPSRFKIKNN